MEKIRTIMVVLGTTLGIGWLSIAAETHYSGMTRINAIMARMCDAAEIYLGEHVEGDWGKYPASLDELAQFAYNYIEPGIGKPLLKEGDLLDTWGEPIQYESDGRYWYIIRSSGPDRTMGTADDIFRGNRSRYLDEAIEKARQVPAVVRQETDAVKKATPEPVRPPVATGKKTPDRVAAKDALSEDAPTETNAAPWKLPLLIGVTILGAIMAWLYFRKNKEGGS